MSQDRALKIGTKVRFSKCSKEGGDEDKYKEGILLGYDIPGRTRGSATAVLFQFGRQYGERIVCCQPWLLEEIEYNVKIAEKIRRFVVNVFEDPKEVDARSDFYQQSDFYQAKGYVDQYLKPLSKELEELTIELSDDSILHSGEKYRRWLEIHFKLNWAYEKSSELKRHRTLTTDLSVEMGRWKNFFWYSNCSIAKSRQVLTQEYIEAIADHLTQSIIEHSQNGSKSVTILDVCAGIDPRFASFINMEIRKRTQIDLKWISIDEMTENNLEEILVNKCKFSRNYAKEEAEIIGDQNRAFFDSFKRKYGYDGIKAETGDAFEKLREIKPDIVICSWMPKDIDFTREFRNVNSIKEYVLIGPKEVCGSTKSWRAEGGFKESVILEGCQLDLKLNMFSDRKHEAERYVSVAYSYKK